MTSSSSNLITTAKEIQALAKKLSKAKEIAFDTEFIRTSLSTSSFSKLNYPFLYENRTYSNIEFSFENDPPLSLAIAHSGGGEHRGRQTCNIVSPAPLHSATDRLLRDLLILTKLKRS